MVIKKLPSGHDEDGRQPLRTFLTHVQHPAGDFAARRHFLNQDFLPRSEQGVQGRFQFGSVPRAEQIQA